MWVRVKTKELKHVIRIPVPLMLAGTILRRIPEEKLGLSGTPVSKEWILALFSEIRKDLKKYKGLVLVEVHAEDGTQIKIRL